MYFFLSEDIVSVIVILLFLSSCFLGRIEGGGLRVWRLFRGWRLKGVDLGGLRFGL